MRKLVVSMNVTLNGYIADADGGLSWHYDLWDDDMARAATLQLAEAGTLLFGRVTYEAMSAHWQATATIDPGPREDADLFQLMNSLEKVVFSRTRCSAGKRDNSRVAMHDLQKEIARLKACAGRDILVLGSGTLVRSLTELGLVDEYRLWVHPVVVSNGKPLFWQRLTLQPQKQQRFASGVVLMSYKPVGVVGC